MSHRLTLYCIVLTLSLSALAGSPETGGNPGIYLFMSEIQAGSLQSQQYCALVFDDHRFHYEKASRRHGRDISRKVYEGQLPEADWNTLVGFLNNKEFRELNVPRAVPPLVMQDSHVFTIAVARGQIFQNMEFLDSTSRKPYESQLKPLLQWWKSFRGGRMTQSAATPDSRCLADNTHAIYGE